MILHKELSIDKQSFLDDYVSKNKPVIISSEDYDKEFWHPDIFSERLGDLSVQVYDALFELQKVSTLSEYLQSEFGHSDKNRKNVPYIRWYSKLKDVDYAWSDQAFSIIAPHWKKPSFLPDTDLIIPATRGGTSADPTLDSFPYRGILVAARGARTRVHRDPFCSDAVVQMFHGSKEIALYHPDRADELRENTNKTSFGGFIDVRKGNTNQLSIEPDFHGVANPGDLIYIPHGWLHDVIVRDDSISVTWNFIHEAGSLEFLDYLIEQPETDSEFEVLQYFYSLAGYQFSSGCEIIKQFNQEFVKIEESYA